MFYFMWSHKYGTEYGKLDGIFNVTTLGQEYATEMGSEFRVVDGEVKMSKAESVIWCSLTIYSRDL